MRAKFRVTNVTPQRDTSGKIYQEDLALCAVNDATPDANGKSEDNDFARWTPCGHLVMSIQNPDLFGKFTVGDKYYLDFTLAAQ